MIIIEEEFNSMIERGVFEKVESVPKNANIVNSRWIFKKERDSEGTTTKFKARLVA